MDRKIQAVQKTVDLFSSLFKSSILSSEDFNKGFAEQIEFAEDNLPDAPQLYKHLGMFLGKAVVDGAISLSSLPELFKPLLASRSMRPPAPILLGELLSSIMAQDGEEALVEVIQADPVVFETFWPADKVNAEVLESWMTKYNLLALLPAKKMPADLESKITELAGDVNVISKWIEDNVDASLLHTPSFVTLLAFVILRQLASQTVYAEGQDKFLELTGPMYAKMKDILTSFEPLLSRVLKAEQQEKVDQLKMAVLQAIESFWTEVGKPQGKGICHEFSSRRTAAILD